jgi:succinate-semialdehyde dehydrogenase/glutarate-semialdehyde dehydrogenase
VHCAQRLIPCYLELGGKDPVIVTASADLERATTAVLRGAVHASGMVCFSVERVYVDERIHDAFVARLVEKAKRRAPEHRQPARRAPASRSRSRRRRIVQAPPG